MTITVKATAMELNSLTSSIATVLATTGDAAAIANLRKKIYNLAELASSGKAVLISSSCYLLPEGSEVRITCDDPKKHSPASRRNYQIEIDPETFVLWMQNATPEMVALFSRK